MSAGPTPPPSGDAEDPAAAERLATLYGGLHRLARRELSRRGSNITVGATTLLHEAYLDMSARDGMVVRSAAVRACIDNLAPHDLRRTCARLCHLPEASSTESDSCSGMCRFRLPSGISAVAKSYSAP